MASTALAIAGLAGGLTSGLLGSNAATTAAGEQTQAEQNALNFQEQVFGQEQANQAPYQQAGVSSLGTLMQALQSGQFGPGSTPNAPQFTQTFTAPTLADAQASPGYQFTAQQGNKGVLQGAAAAGGAISGGTLKALDTFNTGLADSTYNDVFNRALQTYGAGLQGYQANLSGYQANLQNQAQQFNQLLAPVQIGENATANINQSGQQAASTVGQIMGNIGQSQAAGTVGSANALSGGLTSGVNSVTQTLLLNKLFGTGGSGLGSNTNLPAGTGPGWDQVGVG